MGNPHKLIALAMLVGLATSCSSTGGIGAVSGTVTVDGKPVDTGTIHFQPAGNESSKGAGGLIEAGRFTLAPREPIAAGNYNVVIQAFSKTGRIIKDPQKGDVAETAPISVADMPKEVSLSPANSASLEINFAKAAK
jgi:hypothetical protein